jgi:hypothetical protein
MNTQQRIEEIITKVEMLQPVDDLTLKELRLMLEALVIQAQLEELQKE